MPLVFIRHLGNNVAFVHSIDAVDPGYGGGRPGGGDPGYDLPSWARPDQGLPGHGHPGNRPPGSGGGIPDNELPTTPPPQVAAGKTLILVRKDGKWKYAAIDEGTTPEQLPEMPAPTPT
jgi:hypothetical protein